MPKISLKDPGEESDEDEIIWVCAECDDPEACTECDEDEDEIELDFEV